ncbi:MAG: hypothetical protein GX963_06065 [Bacteroidales bacterium]|nr:hypothetical protein [Bacteroidales bacterium]
MMSKNNPEWLKKYPTEIFIGINGPKLDAYALALEGWRRGLTLKWHSQEAPAFTKMKTWHVDRPGQLFSLADENKEHFFFRTRGDIVSNQAVDISANKGITKAYLEKSNVPTPKGKIFDSEATDQEIINYAKELGFPLVIKPTDDSFGRGITVNISNEHEFIEALKYTRHQKKYENIIVEEHITGDDYRLYVVGDQVVSAVHRTPPYVIGDGYSTIKKLINNTNKVRLKNPHLASRLIKIDREVIDLLERSGYTINTILKKDERVFLRSKSNLSAGGDAHEKLEELGDKIKSIAVAAVKSIPELYHCGVDMIIDHEKKHAFVIEINATAHIGSSIFPGAGKAKDIPAAIIDYYFPETNRLAQDSPVIYFPFKEQLSLLANPTLQSITVLEPPVGKLTKSVYKLKGRVSSRRYQNNIKKWAVAQNNISGYLKKISRRVIEVVIVTNNDEILERFEAILKHKSNDIVIEKQTSHDNNHHSAIEVGFKIKNSSKLIWQLKQKRYQYQFIRWILTVLEGLSFLFQSRLVHKIFKRRKHENKE